MKLETSKLTLAIRATPDDVFFKAGSRTPNYNRVFVSCVKHLFQGRRQTAKMLLDGLESGELINLSSFQRAVAADRVRRSKAVGA